MTDDLLLRAAKLFRRIDMDVDLCDLDDGKVSVAEVHAMTAELEARAAAEPTRDFVPDLTPETRRWLEDCIRDQGGAFDEDHACRPPPGRATPERR